MYKFRADEKLIVKKVGEDKDIDYKVYNHQTKKMVTVEGTDTVTLLYKGSKFTMTREIFDKNFEVCQEVMEILLTQIKVSLNIWCRGSVLGR